VQINNMRRLYCIQLCIKWGLVMRFNSNTPTTTLREWTTTIMTECTTLSYNSYEKHASKNFCKSQIHCHLHSPLCLAIRSDVFLCSEISCDLDWGTSRMTAHLGRSHDKWFCIRLSWFQERYLFCWGRTLSQIWIKLAIAALQAGRLQGMGQ
jgi:hypothetical protein